MDRIEEMLKDKGNEFENIKAPDDLEDRLREALDQKRPVKRINIWKTAAIAAGLVMAIGLGSLSFVDFGKNSKRGYINTGGSSGNTAIANITDKDLNVTFSEPLVGSTASSQQDLEIRFSKDIGSQSPEQVSPTTVYTAGSANGSTNYELYNTKTIPTWGSTLTSKANTNKKIIKNANATIQSKKAVDVYDKISKWVISNGGYEFSRNITSDGVNKQVYADFRISPDKLDSMLDFLKSTGKVMNSQVSSSDITDRYQDTDSRLKTMKKGRDQMMVVMTKAKTVEDILKVQTELNNMNANIESLQGQVNIWDKQLAESSVNITISEEKDPLKPEEKVDWKFNSPSEVLKSMKNGFIKTVNYLCNMLIWILVFLSSSVPYVVIGAVLIYLIWRLIRRRKNRV